jgi:methyl-accepting chemotaxis protein
MRSTRFKSVRTKIISTFLVAAVGMGAASGFTLVQLRSTYHLVEQAKTRQLAPTQHARTVLLASRFAMIYQLSITVILGQENGMTLAPLVEQNQRPAVVRALAEARAMAEALTNDDVGAATEPSVDKFVAAFKSWDTLMSPYLDRTARQMAESRTEAVSKATASALGNAYNTLDGVGNILVKTLDEAAAADQRKAESLYRDSVTAAVAVLSACVLLAIALGAIIAQTIRRPLKQTVRVLEGVANGDLTQRLDVSSADEVGQMAVALNSTLSTVHDVIRQIESDADKLSRLAESGKGGAASTARTSEELAEMAHNLSAMIGVFHTEKSSA